MRNEKTGEGIFLNFTNDSADPYVYHVLKCGGNALRELSDKHFHPYYMDDKDGTDDENEDIRRTQIDLDV